MQRAVVSIGDVVVDIQQMRPPIPAAVLHHGVSHEHPPERPGAEVTQPGRHEG